MIRQYTLLLVSLSAVLQLSACSELRRTQSQRSVFAANEAQIQAGGAGGTGADGLDGDPTPPVHPPNTSGEQPFSYVRVDQVTSSSDGLTVTVQGVPINGGAITAQDPVRVTGGYIEKVSSGHPMGDPTNTQYPIVVLNGVGRGFTFEIPVADLDFENLYAELKGPSGAHLYELRDLSQ